MARRILTLEEVAAYRATAQGQLERTLLAGGDTRPARQALADLHEQEAELVAQAAVARDAAQQALERDREERATRRSDSVKREIADVLAPLQPRPLAA